MKNRHAIQITMRQKELANMLGVILSKLLSCQMIMICGLKMVRQKNVYSEV